MNDFQDTLKQLRKQAKQQAEKQRAEAAARSKNPPDIDFAAAMADAVPLKDSGRRPAMRDNSPIRVREQNPQDDAADHFYVGEGGAWQDIPAAFSKNGEGSRDIARLQAGHWPVVADVDLHGYTREEAQQVLNEFIGFVQKRGVCGEIIHGSGLGSSGYTPVLKSLVRRWLMQHPEVLAYAEPHKNNDGAVRILLKRRTRLDPWAEE